MMEVKKVVLVSASPRSAKEAVSEFLTSLAEDRLQTDGLQTVRLNVRQLSLDGRTEEAFQSMLEADALIATFPLYFFCLPGLLTRFLQDYYRYYLENKDRAKKAKVFAIVNCGFPEPDINEEAVRVVRSFSQKIAADFRFGLLIGGGGMILGAKDAPFMKKTFTAINTAFDLMREDILDKAATPTQNIPVAMNFPRRLYFFMGNTGWSGMSKKHGLKKKDLYAKPYLNS